MFFDFVVERPAAYTENGGCEFLISTHVREGRAYEFVFDPMEARSDTKGACGFATTFACPNRVPYALGKQVGR
jgi:hypothetical protein